MQKKIKTGILYVHTGQLSLIFANLCLCPCSRNVINSFKLLATSYHIIQHHIPEDSNIHSHQCENLKFLMRSTWHWKFTLKIEAACVSQTLVIPCDTEWCYNANIIQMFVKSCKDHPYMKATFIWKLNVDRVKLLIPCPYQRAETTAKFSLLTSKTLLPWRPKQQFFWNTGNHLWYCTMLQPKRPQLKQDWKRWVQLCSVQHFQCNSQHPVLQNVMNGL